MATLLQTWEQLSPAAGQKESGRYGGANSALIAGSRKYYEGNKHHAQYLEQFRRVNIEATTHSGSVMFSEEQRTSWASFNSEAKHNYSDIQTAQLGSI